MSLSMQQFIQQGGVFIPYPDIEDRDFYEKIYRKKEFYDTKPPPHPKPDDHTQEIMDKIFSRDGDFRLSAPQRFARNFVSEVTPYNSIFLWWTTGVGKCERKGTKILLHTGESVNIEDIKLGDILMNDRSEGNIVTSLARGRGDMYEITQSNGDNYVANSEHILCLQRKKFNISKINSKGQESYRVRYFDTNTRSIKSRSFRLQDQAEEYLEMIHKETEDILEIPVKEYIDLPGYIQTILKGYRVGVDFSEKKIDLDPYVLGLWLGNGAETESVIYKTGEGLEKLLKTLGSHNLYLQFYPQDKYKIGSAGKNDIFMDTLVKYDLLNNKHIPLAYKANTKHIRLRLLAGIIDSAGYMTGTWYRSRASRIYEDHYIIKHKDYQLVEDIISLCRSLGFVVKGKECEGCFKYNNEERVGTYYHIQITGSNIRAIPATVSQLAVLPWFIDELKVRDPVLSNITVKHIGVDDYYGFTLTGNARYLHHDFTVTHNTCAAISIAERFRNRVEETGKKILMIVGPNIRGEFLKTIFNFEREAAKKSSRQIVQCTGRTYQLGVEAKYLPEKTRERRITKMIKEIYEIIGTDKLRNRIIRETGWNGKADALNGGIVEKLKEMYSDRVIVIDEVHNRVGTEGRDQSIPTILNGIIGSADNIRLVLMSATPMVNSPDDIVFPINLMRLNDRRELIKKRSLFTKEGDFTENGEKLLREAAKGYFSYVRGGEPPRFPYEIVPPEAKTLNPIYMIEGPKIPTSKKMRSTKVIECKMSDYQYRTYLASVDKDKESKIGGLLTGSLQAGNIVFPLSTDDKYGVYGSSGVGDKQSDDHPLIKFKDSRDNDMYRYALYAQGFLLDKYIGKYSVKFKEIYTRITNSIGISFVYSQFLPAGVTSLALMLEENGFLPAIITGKEHELLQSKTKKPPICYMCGEHRHKDNDHQWAPAKYVLLTGSQHLNPDTDIPKISGYINREDNMYGKLVKVLLGSEVSGEGIDFKRIRQVHILEPWYNQARIDQVKGRAIRNGSHRDLPPEQRNVEIFKYCIVPPKRKVSGGKKIRDEEIETVDERDYRYAEDKDRKIKAVEYILKGVAVDCLFERKNNIRNVRRVIKIENSRGQIINFVTGDKPYSRKCDYRKICDYQCVWNPKKADMKIDRSTYGPEFADADIDKARECIQLLFREHFVLDVRYIFAYVKEKESDIDPIYTYLALESLMNPNGEYAVQDLFGREGYLIERDDLFIFQPFDIDDEFAPTWYRENPLRTKMIDSPFPVSEIAKASEEQETKIPKKTGDQIFLSRWKLFHKNKKVLSMYMKKEGDAVDNIILAITLDILPEKWVVDMLKYLLSPSYSESKDKEIEQFRETIIQYYNNKGNIFDESIKKEGKRAKSPSTKDKRKAIMVCTTCTQWGRAEFGVKKRLRKDWGKCDPDIETYMENVIDDIQYYNLWRKIPASKRIRQGEDVSRSGYIFLVKQAGFLPDYVGTVEPPTQASEQKAFKILDFTREEEVTRKDRERSKRSEIRGRVCSTFNASYLTKTLADIEKIVVSLNIPIIKIPEMSKEKRSRLNMCLRLEFLLRVLNQYNDKLWFYIGSFKQEE